MPRFYRGGRGLYRKIMSTNGRDKPPPNQKEQQADNPNNNKKPTIIGKIYYYSVIGFIIFFGCAFLGACFYAIIV